MSTAFKIMKSRKGISPILATLLLIVIAVAAIAVTYAWIMTYMGNTTQQAGVTLYKANVNFGSGTPKNITLDIGNSGTSDTQLVKVYIGTSDATAQSYTFTPSPVSFAAGSIQSFAVTFDWTTGITYYFKVVPAAGQQALTFQAKAP
jgi:flagellin-like protein